MKKKKLKDGALLALAQRYSKKAVQKAFDEGKSWITEEERRGFDSWYQVDEDNIHIFEVRTRMAFSGTRYQIDK